MDIPQNTRDIAAVSPATDEPGRIHRMTADWGRSRRNLGAVDRGRLVLPVVDPAGDPESKDADLVTADRGLPNRCFLERLLAACLRPDCAVRYPLALTRIGLENYAFFKKLYTTGERRQCIDFLLGGLERTITPDEDLVVQRSEEQFYVLSLEASISSATKMMDDLRKALEGLTIPYPRGQVFSEVSLDVGVAIFNHPDGIRRPDTFIELADHAYCLSAGTGRTRVLVYHNDSRSG